MKTKKILKPNEMSKLFGGKEVATSGKKVTDSSTGCTSQVTDTFQDTNNNGKLDCGESHSETMTIVCPK